MVSVNADYGSSSFWGGELRAACPFLPRIDEVLTGEWTRARRGEGGEGLYRARLEYAQSLWRQGKPAQAILQLDKAWAVELGDQHVVLKEWAPPFRALLWIMENASSEDFLGNPVRHYQHLATRMSGPRAELRSWRAWACFLLAEAVLPTTPEFERDERQIERDGVRVPMFEAVAEALGEMGWTGELEEYLEVANLKMVPQET